MTKYAVIQIVGKQYRVSEGDTLVVDRLNVAEGESLTITDVLLVNTGKEIRVGQPLVPQAQVVVSAETHGRGAKIRVATYKAKSRQRKVHGHRQDQTTLKVVSIS